MEDKIFYPTIALAEKAITDAGYVRNKEKAMWTLDRKTAKVAREDGNPPKFFVKWS